MADVCPLPQSFFVAGGHLVPSFSGVSGVSRIATSERPGFDAYSAPSEEMQPTGLADKPADNVDIKVDIDELLYGTRSARDRGVRGLQVGDNLVKVQNRFDVAYKQNPPDQPTERAKTAIVAADVLLRRELSLNDGAVTIATIRYHAAIGHDGIRSSREDHLAWRHNAANLHGRHATAEALLSGGSRIKALRLAVQGIRHATWARLEESQQPDVKPSILADTLLEDNRRAAMLAITGGFLVSRMPGVKTARLRARQAVVTHRRFVANDLR
jgi:hypothetical protein